MDSRHQTQTRIVGSRKQVFEESRTPVPVDDFRNHVVHLADFTYRLASFMTFVDMCCTRTSVKQFRNGFSIGNLTFPHWRPCFRVTVTSNDSNHSYKFEITGFPRKLEFREIPGSNEPFTKEIKFTTNTEIPSLIKSMLIEMLSLKDIPMFLGVEPNLDFLIGTLYFAMVDKTPAHENLMISLTTCLRKCQFLQEIDNYIYNASKPHDVLNPNPLHQIVELYTPNNRIMWFKLVKHFQESDWVPIQLKNILQLLISQIKKN
jgi:hypothetical protein